MICPVCKQTLHEETSRFVCEKGHAYDKAKSGYVNLLIGSSPKSHGDDEAMVLARLRFLGQGHYDPLKDRLIEILRSLEIKSIADLGCGEGSYTNKIRQALNCETIGIDLSKSALKQASKADPKVRYVLANITKTPLADHSVDAVLSVFSPYDLKEAQRISSQYLVLVRPLPKHLLELKAVLYENVLDNPQPETNFPMTTCVLKETVVIPMALDQSSLNDLLAMTPYAHTSPKSGIDRLKALTQLTVTAQFEIAVFRFLHE